MASTCKYIIKTHTDNYNRIIKSIRLKSAEALALETELENIKSIVLDKTEDYINNHRRRPIADQGKVKIIDVLRECSFIEKIDNYTYRLAIGDESELNNKVPYWYVVNYGGIPPDWEGHKFYGIFTDGPPRTGGKGAAWIEGGTAGETGRTYLMRPKNAIPPMHYLNYMAQEFNKEVRDFLGKIKRG